MNKKLDIKKESALVQYKSRIDKKFWSNNKPTTYNDVMEKGKQTPKFKDIIKTDGQDYAEMIVLSIIGFLGLDEMDTIILSRLFLSPVTVIYDNDGKTETGGYPNWTISDLQLCMVMGRAGQLSTKYTVGKCELPYITGVDGWFAKYQKYKESQHSKMYKDRDEMVQKQSLETNYMQIGPPKGIEVEKIDIVMRTNVDRYVMNQKKEDLRQYLINNFENVYNGWSVDDFLKQYKSKQKEKYEESEYTGSSFDEYYKVSKRRYLRLLDKEMNMTTAQYCSFILNENKKETQKHIDSKRMGLVKMWYELAEKKMKDKDYVEPKTSQINNYFRKVAYKMYESNKDEYNQCPYRILLEIELI